MLLYEQSEAHMPEPGDMMRRLIASGFTRLREAYKKGSTDSIAFAVDFINNLCHSEGTLITWIDLTDENFNWVSSDKRYAAYTLTLVSASVYQPEALKHMYRDVRVALRRKALFHRASGVFDPYDREQFLDNFVKRLDLLDIFTAEFALEQIDSLPLIRELLPRIKKGSFSHGEEGWPLKEYFIRALQNAYTKCTGKEEIE